MIKGYQGHSIIRILMGLLLVTFGLIIPSLINISMPAYALDYVGTPYLDYFHTGTAISAPTGPEALPLYVGTGGYCTYATISSAITAAPPGAIIHIEGGVTFNEQLVIDKDLTLEGGYAGCGSGSHERTTVDGTSLTGSLVKITNSEVKLAELVITNGKSLGSGGGISADDNADVVIDYVDVVSNQAWLGGGIYIGSGTTLTATNQSWIASNIATGGGGGVFISGGTFIAGESTGIELNSSMDGGGIFILYGEATLDGSYVDDNDATSTDSNGGGIYAVGTSTVNLSNLSIISNNYAYYGAGIYSDDSTVNVNIGLFLNNDADVDGGGIYLTNGALLQGDSLRIGSEDTILGNHALNGAGIYAITSTINIAGSQIFNNFSEENGGGIYLNSSDLQATNCSLKYNQANNHGGAVAAYDSFVTIDADFDSCDPSLVVCSGISENVADSDPVDYGSGGGIYNDGSEIYLDHTIFSENSANLGGAIYQINPDAYSQVENSLLYRNTVTGDKGAGIRVFQGYFHGEHITLVNNSGAPAIYTSGSDNIEIFNSIIWGNPDGGFAGPTPFFGCNIDQEGIVGVISDPLFLDPGAGDDYHLQYDSPAIDACTTGLPLDLDGRYRPLNGLFDMGSFETWAKIFMPLIFR